MGIDPGILPPTWRSRWWPHTHGDRHTDTGGDGEQGAVPAYTCGQTRAWWESRGGTGGGPIHMGIAPFLPTQDTFSGRWPHTHGDRPHFYSEVVWQEEVAPYTWG